LINLKTFYSQDQYVVKKHFDMGLGSQMMSVVSKKPTLYEQKYAVEEEHTDVKLAYCRTNQPKLERNVNVNENKISEKFIKIKRTINKSELLPFKRFTQKP